MSYMKDEPVIEWRFYWVYKSTRVYKNTRIGFIYTVNPLCTDICYNSKIRYNANSVYANISESCIISLIDPCCFLGKHTFWIFVRIASPRQFLTNTQNVRFIKKMFKSIRYTCFRWVHIKFLYNSKFYFIAKCLVTNTVVITRVLCNIPLCMYCINDSFTFLIKKYYFDLFVLFLNFSGESLIVLSYVSDVGTMGEVLIIHNITRHCGGLYECEAQNGVGAPVRRSINVDVECKFLYFYHYEKTCNTNFKVFLFTKYTLHIFFFFFPSFFLKSR